MGEKEQYDNSIGGSQILPRSLDVGKHAASRQQEIHLMRSYLSSKSGTKLAFQKIPRHMRRRTMSHNVKRLPRRLRDIHLSQMQKSGLPAKQKRPSRSFRRKPKNLAQEYTRRSTKKYRWLQTHIWHAKRFHMVEKWGYKLPYHPCDKAFRACYRAIAHHCLLQDISYVKCVELNGSRMILTENLKTLCDAKAGPTFAAKAYRNGNKEGEVFIFDPEKHTPIGAVKFMWHPQCLQTEFTRIWIWIHPAFYNEALAVIVKLFTLNLEPHSLSYVNSESSITLLEVEGISRLKLMGPLSTSVLYDSFKLLESPDAIHDNWLQHYYSDASNQFMESKEYFQQNLYWQSLIHLSSPAGLTPHLIVSLIVKDPRFNLPKKRTKTNCAPEDKPLIESLNYLNLNPNPLWSAQLRQLVNENKISDATIAEIRKNVLTPGTSCEENVAYVPVVLVQQPGCKTGNIGFGSGWDIILPTAWVKPFWISFIMRSSRAGGLRESNSCLFEMGKLPFLSPDTKSGLEDEQQTCKERITKFFKLPPNKRDNFAKFNITSPFSCNWRCLINEWSTDSKHEEIAVIRDRLKLIEIQKFITSKSLVEPPKCAGNSLIPVRVIYSQKGAPKRFSIICLCALRKDCKSEVVEPFGSDAFEKERKTTREAHKTLLRKLKKKRKKAAQTETDVQHAKVLANYTTKMRSLWLPEATNIRNSCCREVIGFVTSGGFSLSLGKGCGLGYIVASALPALMIAPYRDKVLVRNTNSRLYRAAALSVIVD